MRHIIINADDFGYSTVFNKSILDFLEKWYLKSTTAMVNRIIQNNTSEQQADTARLLEIQKEYQKRQDNISIWLHLEFHEDTITQEKIQAQRDTFIEIFKQEPSHIDVHKANLFKETLNNVLKFCVDKKIVSRGFTNILGSEAPDFKTTDSKLSWSRSTQLEIKNYLENLEENQRWEVIFHPGTYDPKSISTYNKERESDNDTIKLLQAVLIEKNITLSSFLDLKKCEPLKK